MLTLTNALIDATLARLGLHRRTNGETAILGIRGAVPVDATTIKTSGCGGTTNQYDDSIAVYGPVLECFRASVDPGAFYEQHPENAEGCAHLADGSYLYQWGDHKGHPALVEANEVRIWRDTNRNGVWDEGEPYEVGVFGIHIHSGGFTHVDNWSAGCQVLWSQVPWGAEWLKFVKILQASGQRTFTYTLIDAADLNS